MSVVIKSPFAIAPGIMSYNVNNECLKWLNELKLIDSDLCFNKTIYPASYLYVDTPYYVKGSYKDLDHDKDVIKQVVKYYYYKIMQYWMVNSYADLLGYLKIENDVVKFIEDKKLFSNEVDNSTDAHKKIAFLQDKYITKKMVYKWLKKYVAGENVSWYKLQNDESSVKKFIRHQIEKFLIDKIE